MIGRHALDQCLSWPRLLMRAMPTIVRRRLGQSDLKRWMPLANLAPEWDSRTSEIADFIPPKSSVLEFGAGRMVLRSMLPEGCTYVPSDIVDRGPGTIVLDLNDKQLAALPQCDVVVCSGVLEYIHDLPRFFQHISAICKMSIVTYAFLETNRLDELLHRRRKGWMNDYRHQEIVAMAARAGFQCRLSKVLAHWPQQRLFVLSKQIS